MAHSPHSLLAWLARYLLGSSVGAQRFEVKNDKFLLNYSIRRIISCECGPTFSDARLFAAHGSVALARYQLQWYSFQTF